MELRSIKCHLTLRKEWISEIHESTINMKTNTVIKKEECTLKKEAPS